MHNAKKRLKDIRQQLDLLESDLITAEKQLEHQKQYLESYHKALEELEKAGWPCRLEELPSEYRRVCAMLSQKR